jgi:hypothetical protein
MNSKNKVLILILILLIVGYLMNKHSSKSNIDTMADVTSNQNTELSESMLDNLYDDNNSDNSNNSTEHNHINKVHFSKGEKNRLRRKHKSKNTAFEGSHKSVNYQDGYRMQNGDLSQLGESLVKNSHFDNDEYQGRDETGDKYASYVSSGPKKMTDDEIFNADNFLPKETNNDWFDVMPEPVSVKNRHLIDTSRPVGVNTIGNSLRNPSYDLRGTPPCPKFVVTPWMQSTIEPDYNIKGLC